MSKVVAKTAHQVAPKISYKNAKDSVVSGLLSGQKQGMLEPMSGLFGQSSFNTMPLTAESRIQMEMAAMPTVSSTSQGEIIEDYMDSTVKKPIQSYGAAKSAVKQSFLGRMVGPAFAASLLAATATLMPFPAGAYDQIPQHVFADSGLNPSVISPYTDFPTVSQYFGEFLSYALITGIICASPPMVKYFQSQNEPEVPQANFEDMASNY